MSKRCLLALAAAALVSGCSLPAHWRGEQTKRDIFLNLMSPEQAAVFQQMEADQKDDELLLLYCQETGVYQKWKAALPERQKLIRKRQVAEGMSPDEVRMAWGAPAKVEDATTESDRQRGRARTVWLFDGTISRDGSVEYRRQAVFLDEKLVEFKPSAGKPRPWFR